jgi:hypothetical protein
MIATLPMRHQAGHPFHGVDIQPAIDRVRVTRLQEAVAGDGMRRLAVGNLQQRTASFAHISGGMMIPLLFQRSALSVRQC